MLLDELERNIALACSSRMHNGRFAALLHHLHCCTVGFLIMFKQLQQHASHPQPQLRGIFHSNNGGILPRYSDIPLIFDWPDCRWTLYLLEKMR